MKGTPGEMARSKNRTLNACTSDFFFSFFLFSDFMPLLLLFFFSFKIYYLQFLSDIRLLKVFFYYLCLINK